MTITKSILPPPNRRKNAFLRVDTTYTELTGEALLQEYAEFVASDTFGINYLRLSRWK